MTRRDWKRVVPTSLVSALRLCKEFAQERRNLSVERIADLMGVTHDTLYKWLATGRMPATMIPPYELACGCNYATVWLGGCAGKLVIDMPTGRAAGQAEMVELNSGFARALQLLTDFYANPKADSTETLAALQQHLQQVAWHSRNVAASTNPQLEF